MTYRAQKYATALLLAALALLTVPSLAVAGSAGSGSSGSGSSASGDSGGAGLSAGSSPMSAPSSSSTGPLVGDGNATVTASGAGITVSTVATALLRRRLTFTGAAPSSDSGDVIEIERLGRETDYAWAPTVHATIGSDGSFSATWVTNHIGQFSIRAIVETSDAHIASASPELGVVVYLPAIATYYGPGLYGQPLACGGTLRRQTLGVANRTLPCGTEVDLLYNGHTITVPVIDRGPYANHANWDLTSATSKALGMTGTATIGAASLAHAPAG